MSANPSIIIFSIALWLPNVVAQDFIEARLTEARLEASKAQAFVEYPQLREQDSDIYRFVAETTSTMTSKNPAALKQPDWPLNVARWAASQLEAIKTLAVANDYPDLKGKERLLYDTYLQLLKSSYDG